MSDEKYVSGEEYQVASNRSRTASSVSLSKHPVTAVIVVMVLCITSFFIGTQYQKHRNASTSSGSAQAGQLQRDGFGQRGGALGQVTAISAASITVQNQRTNAATTYSITSNTTVSNNGQSAAITDIKAGDTVIIIPLGSSSTTAAHILLNPSFSGGSVNQSSGMPSQQSD